MDLIVLGKQCVKETMSVLDKASAEIIQFKGPTKNVQITADLVAEKTIIDILKESGQNFLIISEEKGLVKTGENPEIEVYIDPIDGSSYFLVGNKRLCSTALMFVKEGKVLASFVGDLITGNIYYCDEDFAYLNDKKIVLSEIKKGERYMVATYATKGQRIKEELPKLADLAQEEIFVFNNSGPLEQTMIVTGQFDAVVDLLPLNLWDFCGTAIAQRAGALVTVREGTSFRYENIKQTCITSRNSEIQEMLLGALNK
ncbi:MAG: inositol monophosphatase family protein [Patescibacteria group bacterium]